MNNGGGHEIGAHKVAHFAGLAFNMDTLYMTWLTMAIVIILAVMTTRSLKMVPGGVQSILEMIIEYMHEQVDANMGAKGKKVAPLVITLFVFLLVANWLGLVPGFTSPTNDLNTTLGLALMIVLLVHILGVANNGLAHFKHFIQPNPLFLPINLIEEISKPVTLSFRLFGNILAGEILMIILGMLVPYIIPSGWLLFSVVVGIIQAFIFTILSISYLSSALKEGHH